MPSKNTQMSQIGSRKYWHISTTSQFPTFPPERSLIKVEDYVCYISQGDADTNQKSEDSSTNNSMTKGNTAKIKPRHNDVSLDT